jgi:hypothetical protein
MMTVLFTCKNCGSGIHVYPNISSKKAICEVCNHEHEVNFTEEHTKNILKECPSCHRKDFYSQKDFNRKIGVILFVFTAIISTVMFMKGLGPQWYLSTFIVLYAVDFILFRRLNLIAICYKCETIFRDVENIQEIFGFNHEMHDRILYKDHDFDGKQLDHH